MPSPQALAYIDSGKSVKPTIIFLHGFLGCKEDWDEIAVPLQDSFRTVLVDLPGHGESVHLDEHAYSMSGSAQLIIETLDHLEISRCRLVGYSMGGRLALYLSVNFANRFARIVVESGSAGLATEAARAERRSNDPKLVQDLRSIPLSDFLTRWYNQPLFHTIKRDRSRFAALIARRLKGNPAELARALEGLGTGSQPYLGFKIARLPHEILFAAGSLDQKYSLLANDLSKLCRHGIAWIAPDAGHALHFEHPVTYIDRLKLFLTEGK